MESTLSKQQSQIFLAILIMLASELKAATGSRSRAKMGVGRSFYMDFLFKTFELSRRVQENMNPTVLLSNGLTAFELNIAIETRKDRRKNREKNF